jgi:hypothetical protein
MSRRRIMKEFEFTPEMAKKAAIHRRHGKQAG